MSLITGVKQGASFELKNNLLTGSGSNLMTEIHYADMDATADRILITTGLKKIFGYIITQLSGTTMPMGFASNLRIGFDYSGTASTAGTIEIMAVQDPGGSGALAVVAANVNFQIMLIGTNLP